MDERPAGGKKNFWLAAGAVAATYAYFLLFAEFAFLELVARAAPGASSLRAAMGALGAGGIAGSFVGLWRFTPERFMLRLRLSYGGCAVAAILAARAGGPGMLVLVAAVIGLMLGWNTVTLATGLRSLLPVNRLGLGAGVGTGMAYALGNVPAIFTAGPRLQTWIVAGIAVLAALGLGGAQPAWPATEAGPRPVWRWVAAFLGLVGFDSAVFYVLQHTPALRDATWSGAANLWGLASVHLVVALIAGRWLDGGWFRRLVGIAGGLLVMASLGLRVMPLPALGFVYAAGVSVYSAALVWFAARDGRPWVAVAVFAIAGWVGSALGIGLVQGG